MSLSDGELRALSGAGALVLAGAMSFAVVILPAISAADAKNKDDDLDNKMLEIDASIAFSRAPEKQPHKEFKPPPPKVDEEKTKVADDPTKKPDPPKPKKDEPKKPQKDQPKKDIIPDRKPKDENAPVGDQKPITSPGQFDPNKRGFADVSVGDPFFRELAADFHEAWQYPAISQTTRTAAGCIHMLENGTIEKIQVKPRSGDDQLDNSVELGLKAIQDKRNAKPIPVPPNLVDQVTTRWICFKTAKLDKQSQ
jgi:outer membrane biosynthesis protein TonB